MTESEAVLLTTSTLLLAAAILALLWTAVRGRGGSALLKGLALLPVCIVIGVLYFQFARWVFLFGGPSEAYLTGAAPFGICFLLLGFAHGTEQGERPKG